MRKIATIAGIVLVSTALGGCQSIFGGGSAFTADASLNDSDIQSYFEQRLAMGRIHLEAGRPTQAVIAFRQASYDPRYAGEALNGMAIAYDIIGRPDLAARYFAEAVAAAPNDPRFARNLARLEGRGVVPASSPVEQAEVEDSGELMALAEPEKPDVRGAITVASRRQASNSAVHVEQRPAMQVAKVSRAEVALAKADTASEGVGPVRLKTYKSASRRVAQRVRRNAQMRKGYPIRIVLRDDKVIRHVIKPGKD